MTKNTQHPPRLLPTKAAGQAGEGSTPLPSPAPELRHSPFAFCETCREAVESVNDADMCERCHDEWVAEQMAHFLPIYEGEKRAGLHGEFTEEGLEMRRSEQARATFAFWCAALEAEPDTWGSMEIAEHQMKRRNK